MRLNDLIGSFVSASTTFPVNLNDWVIAIVCSSPPPGLKATVLYPGFVAEKLPAPSGAESQLNRPSASVVVLQFNNGNSFHDWSATVAPSTGLPALSTTRPFSGVALTSANWIGFRSRSTSTGLWLGA